MNELKMYEELEWLTDLKASQLALIVRWHFVG
jgi:hypothetical protein